MFEKFKAAFKFNSLCSSWGGNPNNLSKGETVALQTLMYIDNLSKDSLIFKSKYVKTDAALLVCLYVSTSIMHNGDIPDDEVKKLMRAMLFGSLKLFGIDKNELIEMQNNRNKTFEEFLYDDMYFLLEPSELDKFIEEACLLFSLDMHYGEFVPFTKDSPVVIMDFMKQSRIELETKSFFTTVFSMLNKYVDLE